MEIFEKLIDPKERKLLLQYIKSKYPPGTEVWDDTRSGPFIVRKNSIFAVAEDEYLVRPEDEGDVMVEFLVRKPGRYSDFFSITNKPKKHISTWKERSNK